MTRLYDGLKPDEFLPNWPYYALTPTSPKGEGVKPLLHRETLALAFVNRYNVGLIL